MTTEARVLPVAPPAEATVRRHTRRPALDGVRALAVTAVVAYHMGGGSGSAVRGGFLGVDVFFVLSGYLITGLLLAEHAATGRIDLPGFWLRRGRRLLPAALLMLLAVAAWVWWTQPPETWPSRRADLLWTVGYGANWHFLAAAQDYFAGYSGASPVRHTWSLAVEEQFYLAWPLLIAAGLALAGRLSRWGASRLRAVGLGILGLGTALSAVAFAKAWSPGDPSAAWYSTTGRAQELLVGALLAVCASAWADGSWPRPAVRAASGVAAVMLAALLATMLLLPDDAPSYFHGGALVVCALAALLLAAVEVAPGASVARVLSTPPLVALGRVSYGVYLWHWPVVVAVPLPARGLGPIVLTQCLRLALITAAVVLSYVLVERPALAGRLPLIGRSRRRFAVAAVAGIAVTVSATLAATNLPPGLAAQVTSIAREPCPAEQPHHFVFCTKVDAGPRAPVLAVLGDSTARALAPGLDDEARRQAFSWVQAAWERCTATGLMVLPNGSSTPDEPARDCAAQASPVIDAMLDQDHPQVVLVAEFWAHYQAIVVDGRTVPATSPEHDDLLLQGFTALVDRVSARGGRTVFLELPPVGDSLGPDVAGKRPSGAGRPADPYSAQRLAYNNVLAAVAAARPGQASVVSVTDLLCPSGSCPAIVDGMLARTDGVHYTVSFSRRLAPVLLQRVRATPAGEGLRVRPSP